MADLVADVRQLQVPLTERAFSGFVRVCHLSHPRCILHLDLRRLAAVALRRIAVVRLVHVDDDVRRHGELFQVFLGRNAVFTLVLILMMVIGGEIGSTSGGIKVSRVYLMLRLALVQIRKKLNPSHFVETPYYVKASGKMPIDRDLADDTTSYVVTYFVIYVIGSLLMTVTAGCSLTEAMFDFASSLSTVGFTIGITGPHMNVPTMIVEMIGMILGRLEIFIRICFGKKRKNKAKYMFLLK